MLKPAIGLLGAVVLMLLAPATASAQCVTFSPDLPCSPLTPPRTPLGLSPAPPTIQSAPPVAVTDFPMRRAGTESRGLDCKMVRSVDPAFQSSMPVITSHSNASLPIRVIPAPACAP